MSGVRVRRGRFRASNEVTSHTGDHAPSDSHPDALTRDGGRPVKRMLVLARDTVLGAILAGGLVALVLDQAIIGLLLCAFALWQFALIYWGKGGLLVDQRWADREGKPNIRSK